jgi:acetylornithine deacetylase/succinyl-diaminopimelate desuccinylase-like protein
MRQNKSFIAILMLSFFTMFLRVAAQSPSAQAPDPLARIRAAAQGNAQACSATGETLCDQVAPKIIANAQGESPLSENLHRYANEMDGRVIGPPGVTRAVAWGVKAFRDTGVDVHTEKYSDPNGRPAERENVVAEIRGREKPDEWVLVGAHLDSWAGGPGVADSSCDDAAVIETARDILRTGILPRRSIRFVLFTGDETGMGVPGSWAYVRAHRAELDRVRAAIIIQSGCLRVTGYRLNGRQDLERGLREALKPIESWRAGTFPFGPSRASDDFDFVVEGIPTLSAIQMPTTYSLDVPTSIAPPDEADIEVLKRNTAIVAVTAFGIAERAAPIGSRQSRGEVESLLKASGLERWMKGTDLWSLWKSGERGRLP